MNRFIKIGFKLGVPIFLPPSTLDRAGAKAAEAGPKRAPEDPIRTVLERLSFRVSSRAVTPALGLALQGYPVDRCLNSKSGSSHLQIDKP